MTGLRARLLVAAAVALLASGCRSPAASGPGGATATPQDGPSASGAPPGATGTPAAPSATPGGTTLGLTLDEFVERWNATTEGEHPIYEMRDVDVEGGTFDALWFSDELDMTGTLIGDEVSEVRIVHTSELEPAAQGAGLFAMAGAWGTLNCTLTAEPGDGCIGIEILRDMGLPSPIDTFEGIDLATETQGIEFRLRHDEEEGLLYTARPAGED